MFNLLREKMEYDSLINCKVDKGQTSMITWKYTKVKVLQFQRAAEICIPTPLPVYFLYKTRFR